MSIRISEMTDNKISNTQEFKRKEPESVAIFSKALDCVDKYTFDILKSPIKNLSDKIDESNSDSKPWAFIKGLGDVADFIFSSEGLLTMGATIFALKGINKCAVRLGGKICGYFVHNYIKGGFFAIGGFQIIQGIERLSKENLTNEDVRKSGEDIGNGALFLLGGYKMKMSKVDALSARKSMTPEELRLQIKERYTKICEELDIPKNLRPKLEIIEENSTTGGAYIEDTHTIQFNTKTYLDGTYKSIEEVLAHEAEHARQAIFKARISEADAEEAVKNILLDRILNGEPEKILVSDFAGTCSMMSPPKMSPKMRAEYAKFAEEEIFGENSYTYFNEFLNHRFGGGELVKSKRLLTKIDEILKNNPDFVKTYGVTNVRDILIEYTWANLSRYHRFSRTKYGGLSRLNLEGLDPVDKTDAINILKEDIETREGNVRDQYFEDSGSYEQYHLSADEIAARNKAAEVEISKLESEPMTQANIERMKVLKFEIKYNEFGRKYYKLYTESLNNPDDLALKKELANVKKKFDSMYNKRIDMKNELNNIYDFNYSPIIGNPNNKTD